ncbi:Rne/Rng family ribonuclease [Micavibrio aeruginosavorus]|uniref:Rne/Rng family ribonuclease n=1 Tax=Micavibrio aeruginosavorus TaxID=349221 RepID=UPI003F4A9546
MAKRMLIDATHAEETRVAVVDGNRLVEFDYESKVRKQLKGSIFLAKVTRVEPSLQAAFVNFGGNRHGFLPFTEIHPDYYRIPIADREALLAEQQAELDALAAEEEAEEAEALARAAAQEGQPEGQPVADMNGDDAEQDQAESDEEDEDDEDEDDEEEDEIVEELGGENRAVEMIDEESDDEDEIVSAPVQFIPIAIPVDGVFADEQDDDGDVAAADDADDGDDADEVTASNAEGQAEGEESAEGASEEGAEGEAGNDRRRGRGNDRGNDRGRGNGRGRGRGRGGRHERGGRNMASNSRRVEMLGGDGVDGDRPLRPSLRKNYKIQEVIKRSQIMLIQVSKEERGNKGAAVTTYLSLPGRYCVLMPNSPRGGGVSRKIANFEERRRMKEILSELNVPEGMSVIMRTAGMSRTKQEIKRDLDYLLRLWNDIRDLTLQSSAPAQIHEEGNLVRRAVRDLYSRDIEEIHVAGEDGFKIARDFMKVMMPSHAKRVVNYQDEQIPLFHRYQVESQIRDMGNSTAQLKSGGYLVINPTEALVSVDVNSGRATKERHIEETALKTNLEAADEVARQLRLRDLGGLVVIDFIDMEDRRNNAKVERRLKEALSTDRARIQMGRISSFGLLEMSRQRLNPSLTEAQFEKCHECGGAGHVRTEDSASILALRALEEEGIRGRATTVHLTVPPRVALYILNHKRAMMEDIERRYGFTILIRVDEDLTASDFKIESIKAQPRDDDEDGVVQVRRRPEPRAERAPVARTVVDDDQDDSAEDEDETSETDAESDDEAGEGDANAPREEGEDGQRRNRRRRGRRGGRNRNRRDRDPNGGEDAPTDEQGDADGNRAEADFASDDDAQPRENTAREHTPREGNRDGNREGGREGSRGRNRSRGGRNRGGRDNRGSRDDQPQGQSPMNQQGQERNDNVDHGYAVNIGDVPPAPVSAPAPVRERAPAFEMAEPQARPQQRDAETTPPPARDYERVNEEPSEKKKGWWNRLME